MAGLGEKKIEEITLLLRDFGILHGKVEVKFCSDELGMDLDLGEFSSQIKGFGSNKYSWIKRIDTVRRVAPALYHLDREGVKAENFELGSPEISMARSFVTLDGEKNIIRLYIFPTTDIELFFDPNNSLTLKDLIVAKEGAKSKRVKLSIDDSILNLKLRILNIEEVSVEYIPKQVFFLETLEFVGLRHIRNLDSPPKQICEQGLSAIKNYYSQLDKPDGTDFLYEAKMVLVGRGLAGKTTIVKKLINPNYQIDHQSHSTEGIDISEWTFPMKLENSDSFKFNIWDFGGQEKYDATHQFFITERTLYLFVTEARQESNYLDFDYWLNVVHMLSDGSPVLVVQNKIDKRKKQLPTDRYRGLFDNIQAFINVSCEKGFEATLKELKSEIKQALKRLPQVGDELPKAWVDVRKELEDRKELNHIQYDEYLEICKNFGLNEEQADYLSRYFHDLGIIVHYMKDPLLRQTVVVNPDWAVDGVYEVLDEPEVEDAKGRFNDKNLNKIWKDEKYENKRGELLALMKNYELCFELGNSKNYIAPELLSPNSPPEYKRIDRAKPTLTFLYKYDFMPAGMLTRLIVKTHKFIDKELFWKHGVVLQFEGAKAAITEDEVQKTIRICVFGKRHSRELLAIVRKELMEIHSDFNRKIKYEELTPCNCSSCQTLDQEPHYFKWRTLINFLEKDKNEIPCEVSAININVKELVGEVRNHEKISNWANSESNLLAHQIPVDQRISMTKSPSSDWNRTALIGGLTATAITFLFLMLPLTWYAGRIAMLVGALVCVFLLIRNPIRRYLRGFWAILSIWSGINLIPGLLLSGENIFSGPDNKFNLQLDSPNVWVNFGAILLMIVLLVLDQREQKRHDGV